MFHTIVDSPCGEAKKIIGSKKPDYPRTVIIEDKNSEGENKQTYSASGGRTECHRAGEITLAILGEGMYTISVGGVRMKDEEILAAMRSILEPIQADIKEINTRLGSVDSRLGSVDSRLGSVDSRLGNVDSRLDNVDSRLGKVDSRLDNVDSRLDNVEDSQQTIRASQLKVELEHLPRIQAALDGIVAGVEKNKAQDGRIDALEHKAEDQDIKIFALEHAVMAR